MAKPPAPLYLGEVVPFEAGGYEMVDHTLRHFVAEDAGAFDRAIEIMGKKTSGVARWELGERGRDVGADVGAAVRALRALRPLERLWENRALWSTIQGIHDDGYAPRYEAAVRSCREPGLGSPWSGRALDKFREYQRFEARLEWANVLLAVDMLEVADPLKSGTGRLAIRTAHWSPHELTTTLAPAVTAPVKNAYDLYKKKK